MRTKMLMIAALAALAVQAAHAQDARPTTARAQNVKAPDVNTALYAAANALGMIRGPQQEDALSTMECWGRGTMYALGQAFRPDMPWPAFKVTSYRASIGYDVHGVPGMRVDLTRTNPDGPVQGGGGLPLQAPQRQIQVVADKFAWNEVTPGMNATPAMGAVNERLLQLWATPYGVIKAARQAGTNAKVTIERGSTVITFPLPAPLAGTTMKATLNAKNLIERVETRADSPVLGDIVIETIYSDYGDWNDEAYKSDVLFPRHIVQTQGGFPVLDLTITKTNTYNPYVVYPVPENVERAAAQMPPQVKVDTQKVADGVWYLTGGSHHSIAVEFKNHVVLIEAPQNDARTLAVIDTVKKTIPNKPIKYVVNTHHHFDHSGGLRAAGAEGATIITQSMNKPYYEKVWAMPHGLNPDRLAKSPRKPVIEAVDEKRVLSDGTRSLELYRLRGSDHADTMLMAYLPKEKILVEADVYTPTAANAKPGPLIKETVNLYDNIQRLKLNVQQIAPIHGRLVTIDDLRTAIGRTSK